MTREEVHLIAEEVSQQTINKLFMTVGVNIEEPKAIFQFQKDLLFLRGARESTEAVQRRGLLTIVTFVITGFFGWLIYGLKWHP